MVRKLSVEEENIVQNAIAVKEQIRDAVFAKLASLKYIPSLKTQRKCTLSFKARCSAPHEFVIEADLEGITGSDLEDVRRSGLDVNYILRLWLADGPKSEEKPLPEKELGILAEEVCSGGHIIERRVFTYKPKTPLSAGIDKAALDKVVKEIFAQFLQFLKQHGLEIKV